MRTHPNPKQTVIFIDRHQYKVTVDKMSETELRALPEPDISAEFDLWLEQPGHNQDRRLTPGEIVDLHNGMHVTSVQRATTPG